MGLVNSHEASRRAVGPRCKSSEASPAPPRHKCSKAQGVPPEVRIGKVKLNNIAAGDATTCCTTSCGSSLSGASGSRETTSTWGAASQPTSTVSNQSNWENSLTPRAISSIGSAIPDNFLPQKNFPSAMESTCKPSPRADKNSRSKSPGVRGLWHAFKRNANHGDSKEGNLRSLASYLTPQEKDSEPAETSANALRLHILREEEEHKRRRQSDHAGFIFPAVSAVNAEPPPFPDGHDRLTAPPNAYTLNRGYGGPTPSERKASPLNSKTTGGALPTGREPPRFASNAEAPSGPAPGRRPLRRSLVPPSSHRSGSAPSSWIADAPLDGRWEIERGVWTRQGVHENQLGFVVDERFKAFATSMRRAQPMAESPSPGPPGRFEGPSAPVSRVAVGPLAARMRQQQQTQLQAGQQVVPMTNRGMAAATTIQLAKRRQANEERRRYQQRHIASPGASSTPAGMPGASAGVPSSASKMQNFFGAESQFGRTKGVATAERITKATTAEGSRLRCWPDEDACGTFAVGSALQFCAENKTINLINERDSRLHNDQKEELRAAQFRCDELSLNNHGSACGDDVAGRLRGACNSARGSDGSAMRAASVPPPPCQNQSCSHFSVQVRAFFVFLNLFTSQSHTRNFALVIYQIRLNCVQQSQEHLQVAPLFVYVSH